MSRARAQRAQEWVDGPTMVAEWRAVRRLLDSAGLRDYPMETAVSALLVAAGASTLEDVVDLEEARCRLRHPSNRSKGGAS